MPFVVTIQRNPGYVRFDVAGPASLKNYFDLMDEVARETRANTLVLVDLRGVIGRLHVSDQIYIGEVVAQKLAHLRKLATVVPDDPATYNSERVANQKGLNLRTFAREDEAVAWLSGPGQAGPTGSPP